MSYRVLQRQIGIVVGIFFVFCSVPRSNEAGALASFEENRRYYDDDGVDLFTKAFSILFS
eukprot:scaffold7570_cov147-Skeletonema_menzelii.AAC.1